jgi:DJ-1/PfpI family
MGTCIVSPSSPMTAWSPSTCPCRSRSSAALAWPTTGRPTTYGVRACAEEVDAGLLTIRAPHSLDLDVAVEADTVVIPGTADIDRPIPTVLVDAITAARGRLVSICTGAFTLAATGRLGGRRATTHWAAATDLARRHPAVEVNPDVLFVDAGQVLTSAGSRRDGGTGPVPAHCAPWPTRPSRANNVERRR